MTSNSWGELPTTFPPVPGRHQTNQTSRPCRWTHHPTACRAVRGVVIHITANCKADNDCHHRQPAHAHTSWPHLNGSRTERPPLRRGVLRYRGQRTAASRWRWSTAPKILLAVVDLLGDPGRPHAPELGRGQVGIAAPDLLAGGRDLGLVARMRRSRATSQAAATPAWRIPHCPVPIHPTRIRCWPERSRRWPSCSAVSPRSSMAISRLVRFSWRSTGPLTARAADNREL